MTALPRLSGPRVVLVPADAATARAVVDGTDVHAALDDRDLRPAAGWPHDDSAHALRPVAAQPDSDGPVPCWLVVDGDEVVGECGTTGPVDPDGDLELGYGLAAPRRGQGLGTETVAVLAAWAERQPDVRRLVARVLPGNEASWRVLHKVGFERERLDGEHDLWVRGRGPGSARRVTGRHVC